MKTKERFKNFHDGRGIVDTDMHPRVLAAQIAESKLADKRIARARERNEPVDEFGYRRNIDSGISAAVAKQIDIDTGADISDGAADGEK